MNKLVDHIRSFLRKNFKIDSLMNKRDIIVVWRVVTILGTVFPVLTYFVYDQAYLPEEPLQTTLIFRICFSLISLIALVASLIRKSLAIKYWWTVHVVSIFYYIFFSWLDSISENPVESGYYVGIIQVSIGVLAFRISRVNLINFIFAILIYLSLNYSKPQITSVLFDLATYALMIWVVFRNFERSHRSEIEARWREYHLKQKFQNILRVVEEIDHDLKPALQIMSKYSGTLKYKLKVGRDREIARLLQYYTSFVYTQVCNLLEFSRRERDVSHAIPLGSTSFIRAYWRSINALMSRNSVEIDDGGRVLFKYRRIRIASTHDILIRILNNIIDNAIKYAAPDTFVKIRCNLHDGFLDLKVQNRVQEDVEDIDGFSHGTGHLSGSGIGLQSATRLLKGIGGELTRSYIDSTVISNVRLPIVPSPASN